jgi:RES domain-containing protein
LVHRPARDPDLLDQLDVVAREDFAGDAWRVVREGRDPLQPSHIGGRWDMGANDALYTSLASDGAIAEIHFRLRQEPVFPSRFKAMLYHLKVEVSNVLRFDDLDALRPFGVDGAAYHRVLYDRTQEIGDAAQFLGRKGIIVPSARWDCLNLVLYEIDPNSIAIVKQETVDWDAWRKRTDSVRRANAHLA